MEFLVAVLLAFVVVATSQGQVIPDRYFLESPAEVRSVNGSSATGFCPQCLELYPCRDPTSSVLFDGNIPTLTGLDGNMWASQLLTIQNHSVSTSPNITFYFPRRVGIKRSEIVLFNCPEWGVSVQDITVYTRGGYRSTNPTVTSCDSLVRVCIENANSDNCDQAKLTVGAAAGHWVHIAEVTFYDANSNCPPNIIITPLTTIPATTIPSPPPPPPDTTVTAPTSPPGTIITTITIPPGTTPHPNSDLTTVCACDTQSPSSPTIFSTPTILASVLTAISTALLATIIFVLVQVALCKCRPKATPGGAESAPSAGGEELEYEEVDESYEEVVAMGNMETGSRENRLELKANTAYRAFAY